MILLMGGTSESPKLAEAMADAGFRVLVSMATEVPLAMPQWAEIQIRRGRLNAQQLVSVLVENRIAALVDAMHPFAMDAHATARTAAQMVNIPYLPYLREQSDLSGVRGLQIAESHEQAAQMAVALACPILLTVGSRNLAPYVREARTFKLPIYARVLPYRESEEACTAVGLSESEVIKGRGPFTVQDTLELIRTLEIGTLVTKESGSAGGVPEKLEAASAAQCKVIVVGRVLARTEDSVRNVNDLIQRLVEVTQQSSRN